MPLGGFATSRTPLAAVAPHGAEDNVSDDDPADVSLSSELILLSLSLLCTSAIGCSAIWSKSLMKFFFFLSSSLKKDFIFAKAS